MSIIADRCATFSDIREIGNCGSIDRVRCCLWDNICNPMVTIHCYAWV